MRGTIGPCSQGRSACRQMWWCASTMPIIASLRSARLAKRRRAWPRGAVLDRRQRAQQPLQRRQAAAVGERVEDRQDAGHGARQRPVARIGGERRHPDQAVAEPRQAIDGVDHRRRIAAFEPVGKDQRDGAAHQRCMARHRQEFFQRRADPRAAVEVEDEVREPGQRLVGSAMLQRCGDARQPRAEAERLDLRARARVSSCAKRSVVSECAFIEPETSTSSSSRRGLSGRVFAKQPQRLAGRAPRRARGARDVDAAAARRGHDACGSAIVGRQAEIAPDAGRAWRGRLRSGGRKSCGG